MGFGVWGLGLGDGIDELDTIDHLAVFKALNGNVVFAVAGVQRFGTSGTGGLHHVDGTDSRRVIAIELRREEIDEGTQEVAGTELKDHVKIC